MPPKAILFDFDGTIVDTEWEIYQAWVRTYQREGQELPIETYVQCIGSDFDSWSPKAHLETLTGKSFHWDELDLSRNQEIRDSLQGEGAVEGFPTLLASLASQARLAVVSSSTHSWVDGWLEKLSLNNLFETTVCRGDAPRIKPAPDLYLAAAERLGLSPEDCLVVEDSYNGMRAAHLAGMKAFVIPSRITRVSDFSAAEGVYKTIPELAHALSTLFSCKKLASRE